MHFATFSRRIPHPWSRCATWYMESRPSEGLGHIGTGYVNGQTQVMISRGFTGFVRSNKTRPFGMSLNVFGIFLYRFVGILRRRMLDSGNHSTLF